MICKIMRPQKFMWHNIMKSTKKKKKKKIGFTLYCIDIDTCNYNVV